MLISDAALIELQGIIYTERNIFLSLDEVRKLAERLIGLYAIILKNEPHQKHFEK